MEEKTVKVVYETVRQSVFTQLKSAANIDTKISVIIGFNALIFILSWQLYPNVQNILFFLGDGLLIISLCFLFGAYHKRNWYISPSPQALVKRLKEGKKIEEIYWHTIRDITGKDSGKDKRNDNKTLGIYRVNQKKISYKNHLLNISIYLLIVSLVIIGLSRTLYL